MDHEGRYFSNPQKVRGHLEGKQGLLIDTKYSHVWNYYFEAEQFSTKLKAFKNNNRRQQQWTPQENFIKNKNKESRLKEPDVNMKTGVLY